MGNLMDIISDLISGLVPNLWGCLIAAGTALLGVLGIYIKGRRDAKAKADLRDLKGNAKTIEDVLCETVSADPADDIRRRMRERSK